MSLCVVRGCEHRRDPDWRHVAPPRDHQPTAHLRVLPDEEEAA